MSKYGDISGPNTGKYGPEKNPYLYAFQAVWWWDDCLVITWIGKHGSSRPEVFCKKVGLENFTKFTGKHLCQSHF